MDERLKAALEFSKYHETLTNQLDILKSKYHSKLIVAENGGAFTVDQSFLSFVNLLLQHDQEYGVFIDNNGSPVMIENLQEFYDNSLDLYIEAMNEYHEEFQAIRKARKVEDIIGLKE